MTKYLTSPAEYDVKARRISGTHAEKLEQIDAAIQELLDIKVLECAGDRPGVQFLTVPKPRSHAIALLVTLLAMLILLVLLLGVRANHLFRTRGTSPTLDEWGVDVATITAKKAPAATSRWGVELTAQTGHDRWGADFTPSFMLGGNLGYPFTDRFTLTGFVVNSYFHLSQPNSVPNVGAQLAFALTPQLSLKQNLLWGSQQAGTSLSHWRILSDTIVERKRRASRSGASCSSRPRRSPRPASRRRGWRRSCRVRSGGRPMARDANSTGAEGGFFSGPDNALVPHQHLLIAAFILAFDHAITVSK